MIERENQHRIRKSHWATLSSGTLITLPKLKRELNLLLIFLGEGNRQGDMIAQDIETVNDLLAL